MSKQRVRIVNAGSNCFETICYINDQKIKNVKSVDFHVSADEIPITTFEVVGVPEIIMDSDVRYSFSPETVQEAATILKHEFTHNMDSRKALIASIESIIREEYNGYCAYELARKVANRIAGSENF